MQAGGYVAALPQLSVAEKALLYHYTEDGYDALNTALHDHSGEASSALGQAMEAVLAKLPPFVGEVFSGAWLRRSELAHYRACAQTGAPVRWPAFYRLARKSALPGNFCGLRLKTACSLSVPVVAV